MAVDLAKLSLWLATMAKDHPFTFLDHAIKCGDSLVGLTNQQIAAFHWDPTQARERIFGQEKLEQQIAKVAEQRKRILDWTEDTESAVLKKRDFLAAADSAAASLKTTGDLVIAAFFAGEKPKQRQQLRDEFLHRHLELQKGDAQQIPWEINTLKQLRGGEFPVRPFHWEIEFPEVFYRENPGFDAIAGNPPFLGGSQLSALLGGPTYLEWLKTCTIDAFGNADLSSYFFRRAFSLISSYGTIGYIATKTIAEGSTRTTGLQSILSSGGTIYNAVRSQPWPGEASVLVAVVHLANCNATLSKLPLLDAKSVPQINSRMLPGPEVPDPVTLASNSTKGFFGTKLGSSGFILSPEESEELLKDPKNSECILPYLGGEEINTSPIQAHDRLVICFRAKPLEFAQRFPDLLHLVFSRVKPERDKALDHGPGKHGKKYWWQHTLRADPLYENIEGLSRCLVTAITTAHLSFSFQPIHQVFAHSVVAFAFEKYAAFAFMQGSVHRAWALLLSSYLGGTLRYSVSDAFHTFPFPTDWEENAALEEAGKTYYEYRAELMVRNDEGLTKTYNRFHDPDERSPDIQRLRDLHAAMDRAVLDAYGWGDIVSGEWRIANGGEEANREKRMANGAEDSTSTRRSPLAVRPLACEFLLDYEDEDETEEASDPSAIPNPRSTIRRRRKPWRYRWPDDIRDEVLARLLALNAQRAEQERLAGTGKTTAKKATSKSKITDRPKRDDEMI